jgi:hypothetical protein
VSVRSVTLRQEELRDFARAERHKRLSKGRFRLPATTAGADRVTIDKTELAMILGVVSHANPPRIGHLVS